MSEALQIIVEALRVGVPAIRQIVEQRVGRDLTEDELRAALRMLAEDPPRKVDFGPDWGPAVDAL